MQIKRHYVHSLIESYCPRNYSCISKARVCVYVCVRVGRVGKTWVMLAGLRRENSEILYGRYRTRLV